MNGPPEKIVLRFCGAGTLLCFKPSMGDLGIGQRHHMPAALSFAIVYIAQINSRLGPSVVPAR